MEVKKHESARVGTKRGLFLNIGLILSLLLCITAFEWKFYDDVNFVDVGRVKDTFDELADIPPTVQPPPPPPIQQPIIKEVPNEEEIDEELEVDLDIEITEETVIAEIENIVPEKEEELDEIVSFAEKQPEPKDGLAAFYNYIYKRIKYPSQARRMGVEGRVFIQFVVGKDGSLQDVQPLKGKEIGAGCEEEAIRVIKSHPNWNPGKQRGRPVKVRMIIPITFKLG